INNKESIWSKITKIISDFIGLDNNQYNRIINFIESKNIRYKPTSIQKLEINVKYDAKYVEAVKKGEMTKEQAMQALEKVGRKNSDAYAKLASLEGKHGETKMISPEEMKKLRDEKRHLESRLEIEELS